MIIALARVMLLVGGQNIDCMKIKTIVREAVQKPDILQREVLP
jgi:hypothetical protein